jgi:hypothetical protein
LLFNKHERLVPRRFENLRARPLGVREGRFLKRGCGLIHVEVSF